MERSSTSCLVESDRLAPPTPRTRGTLERKQTHTPTHAPRSAAAARATLRPGAVKLNNRQ